MRTLQILTLCGGEIMSALTTGAVIYLRGAGCGASGTSGGVGGGELCGIESSFAPNFDPLLGYFSLHIWCLDSASCCRIGWVLH